jgi:hypothetical protein
MELQAALNTIADDAPERIDDFMQKRTPRRQGK